MVRQHQLQDQLHDQEHLRRHRRTQSGHTGRQVVGQHLLRTTDRIGSRDQEWTNSITLHTHAYDRDYDDAHYESQTYMVRAQHQTKTWGVGLDYKNDQSLTGDHDNLGYFINTSYNIFSLHYRQDRDHDSYKVGFLQPLTDSLTLRGNHSTGYKNKTTWGAEEFSNTQEISLDYNRFTTTFFQSDVGDLNSEGIELSYGVKDFRVFASHLNSRTNDSVNLRRPKWNLGLMHN